MRQETLVLLKPDAVRRNLVGEITMRIMAARLTIAIALAMTPTRELASAHYGDLDQRYGDKVKEQVVSFLCSGEIWAIIAAGEDAVAVMRELIGATDPAKADPKSIRGALGMDSMAASKLEDRCVYNLIHASATPEEALAEIRLWFPDHVPAGQ